MRIYNNQAIFSTNKGSQFDFEYYRNIFFIIKCAIIVISCFWWTYV